MNMTELWPSAVFGPISWCRFGYPGHGEPVIGFGPLAPVLRELVTRQAADRKILHVDARIDQEAGAEHDAIDGTLLAVVGEDAGRGDFADAFGHELHVVRPEHRVPVVR